MLPYTTRCVAAFLGTATLAFASLLPSIASTPVRLAAQPLHLQSQMAPPAEAGACVPLEIDNTASGSSRSDATAGHVIPPRQTLPGLRSFGQVTPTLYRGARPTQEGLECLAKMGFNILYSSEGKFKDLRKPTERLGMQYVSSFWECSFPHDHTFAEFLQFLRDNPGKKVFVFCHYGDDRTGMLIAAYRMAEQGWSAEEAKNEMEAFGFDFWHRRICTGLSNYEEHFPRYWRESPAFEKLRSAPPPAPQP